MASPLSHSERRLTSPAGWVLRLAHRKPRRLVVFVHGFGGSVVSTWQRFPELASRRSWWTEADMLFVGYRSKRDNLTQAAARLREHLPTLFPTLPADLLSLGDTALRDEPHEPYQELALVGHSLGGVIVRRVLCDLAQEWEGRGFSEPAPPVLASASSALFSPASAGFRPAGLAGLAYATPLWLIANTRMSLASAYKDLDPASDILISTRRRTEELARARPDLAALRARILWAGPDNIVLTERYDTDPLEQVAEGRSHRTVCKPSDGYERPLLFVEDAR